MQISCAFPPGPQVVDDARNGLLVPVHDAGALARALQKVATDPALRAEMGNAGRAKARADFDQRRCIEVTLHAYESLLGNVSEAVAA